MELTELLTTDEIMVLDRMARSMSTQTIAVALCMTDQRATFLEESIFGKLKLSALGEEARRSYAKAIYAAYCRGRGVTADIVPHKKSDRVIDIIGTTAHKMVGLPAHLLEVARLISERMDTMGIAKSANVEPDEAGKRVADLYQTLELPHELKRGRRPLVAESYLLYASRGAQKPRAPSPAVPQRPMATARQSEAPTARAAPDASTRTPLVPVRMGTAQPRGRDEHLALVAQNLRSLSRRNSTLLQCIVDSDFDFRRALTLIQKRMRLCPSTTKQYLSTFYGAVGMPFMRDGARKDFLKVALHLRDSLTAGTPQADTLRGDEQVPASRQRDESQAIQPRLSREIAGIVRALGELTKDERNIVLEVIYAEGDIAVAAKNLAVASSPIRTWLNEILKDLGLDPKIEEVFTTLKDAWSAYRTIQLGTSTASTPDVSRPAVPPATRQRSPQPEPATTPLPVIPIDRALIHALTDPKTITGVHAIAVDMVGGEPPPIVSEEIAKMRPFGYEPEIAITIQGGDANDRLHVVLVRRGGQR